jgi:hypothetical protein
MNAYSADISNEDFRSSIAEDYTIPCEYAVLYKQTGWLDLGLGRITRVLLPKQQLGEFGTWLLRTSGSLTGLIDFYGTISAS